jgi:hypothetical protein
MNYALLGLLALVLLLGLVAFGVGHKRWSWGTLIAAFLVLLAAAGYLYVASRFAAYEWSWARFVGGKQVQLAQVRDALVPDAAKGGRLKPLGGEDDDLSTKPIAELVKERERWQRALDRIDTWHGRSWAKASFEPPKQDGATGTLEIPFGPAAEPAAEGEAAPAEPAKPGPPPLDEGATVYLFEDVPAQEGGRYLGAFIVQAAEVDGPAGRFVLTVAQTEARDAYDTQVWSRAYDSVTVYETLPSDRWLAFSKTAAGGSPVVAPEPQRLSLEQVEGLLEERDRQRTFLEEFEKHETVADKDEWERIRQRLDEGVEQPGSYWAVVKFTQTAAIATGIDDEAAARSFEPGETAECDLQTAFALAADNKATIEEVRYRRRLQDAGTFIHGARIFRGVGPDAVKESIAADGVAGLVAVLRREIRSLDDSTKRLAESRADVEAELKATEDRRQRLAADRDLWNRDADAAERTAGAFAAEVTKARQLLAATEAAIVARAGELREAVGRLAERIDAAAPAPVRTAAGP